MPMQRRSRATPLTAELLQARKRRMQLAVLPHPARDYEAELREREALHRLACEAGRTGSWYVRLDTGEITLSPMAAALVGLPAQEMITIPAEAWRKRIDPGHLPALDKVALGAARDNRTFGFEFKLRGKDGADYWLYVRGGVHRDAAGRAVRIHGAIVDLTEQKQAKDELSRLNETLEQRVAERTAELVEAQQALRQSQKLEAMGQLTGGIAHDFNNLLTPIIANLDLLQKRASDPREQRLIEGALRSADSGKVLIQRLLAFARRQALEPVRVDLGELVESLADLIGRTIGPRIRVVLELAPGAPPALADRNQLEMAILNLSVNARDAMPMGGMLTIRVEQADVTDDGNDDGKLARGHYVRLSIVDTGVGMDQETCARAVEPFFSTKGVGEGTGLGLSMVDGLASQMGGAFRLESAKGMGTTAILWLPVWNEAAEPALADAPAPPAARSANGTALVVDDHDLVRISTAEMLTDLGYEAIQARSGEEAAEFISGGLTVDLLVTDHLMPGMSGVDLARLVRVRQPRLPVLLVSGDTDSAGIPPGLACLTKPFRKAQLAERIEQVKKEPVAA